MIVFFCFDTKRFYSILGEISDDEIQYFGNVDQPDLEFGFSAIHWSAFYGQLKTTEKLLELGSNPNVFASNLITPLHLSGTNKN